MCIICSFLLCRSRVCMCVFMRKWIHTLACYCKIVSWMNFNEPASDRYEQLNFEVTQSHLVRVEILVGLGSCLQIVQYYKYIVGGIIVVFYLSRKWKQLTYFHSNYCFFDTEFTSHLRDFAVLQLFQVFYVGQEFISKSVWDDFQFVGHRTENGDNCWPSHTPGWRVLHLQGGGSWGSFGS